MQHAILCRRHAACIVGGNDHRHAHLIEILEDAHDVSRVTGVQIAGRFIGNQNGWAVSYTHLTLPTNREV